MKAILTSLFLLLFVTQAMAQDIGLTYMEEWKKFYPSKALAQGFHASIFTYENLSPETIQTWLAFNKKTQQKLATIQSKKTIDPIDARLLRLQIQAEIYKWEKEAPQQHSLSLYTTLISRALRSVSDAGFLSPTEKAQLSCQRLEAVQRLCSTALGQLKNIKGENVDASLKRLAKAVAFYQEELPQSSASWKVPPSCPRFAVRCQAVAALIQSLHDKVKEESLTTETAYNPVLGRAEYARQLSQYTDGPLSPAQLEEMALAEIEEVRKLIEEVSKAYLQTQYPKKNVPTNQLDIIKAAFADMEADAPTSGADYLAFWQALSTSATQFIEENKIATLPPFQTLRIMPAPESAGPAARIGWVDSAPPFAPNPLTTLYLPSIPESLPAQERKDFWASFNKPFNRMIVIHELFPGHYMQIKVSRESPHPVRLLFPYRLYFEGWATFTERVLLDAGWEKENKLTLLAHLRKRLENANRAYTSVMVHCEDWTEEQVMQFSTETSLLAPQFAKSLWGRLMRSPMQMTSYFLGGKQFTDLLAAEKKRQGDQFVLIDFMDTILRAGPIPIDEIPALLK